MGFFKKIFKGIKKVFKGIGRTIKKGFKKFGKFMNKLGIVGQIGMMFIMPQIGAFAMKGLSALGSGFMQGLASATGPLSGAAKFAHGVLSNAANIAKTGISAVRTITDTIGGVVADSVRTVASKVTGGYIQPLSPTAGTFQSQSWYGKIGENVSSRFTEGVQRTAQLGTDSYKQFIASVPGGEAYNPQYKTFTDPADKLLKTRPREITYSTENQSLLAASPEQKIAQTITPSVMQQPDVMRTEAASKFETNVLQDIPDTALPDITIDGKTVTPSPPLTDGIAPPTSPSILGRVKDTAAKQFSVEGLTTAALGQASNLAIQQLMKEEELAPSLAMDVPRSNFFEENYLATVGQRGSGQSFQNAFGEPISEEALSMNRFLGLDQGDAYWNFQTNTRDRLTADAGITQFIGSYI